MCNFPMISILESQLFAAVVGALIGIFPAYWIGLLHERKKEQKEYQSWLAGLSAELGHIDKCIDEITPIIQGGNPSTKRMNSDFLEQARLAIFSFDVDESFLESLTNAYRDIVHTNDMLNRFEKKVENRNMIQGNTLASMNGVKNSVSALKEKVSQKRNN